MKAELHQQEQRIRASIARFLATQERDPSDGFAGLRELAMALDNLVAVYFETDDADPDGEAEAPQKTYAEYYQRAARAYPELGLYPYADVGADSGADDPLVADAIDDLGDIAGDLEEVIWYFDNSTQSEAIWQFRWGYQNHWGDHLHSLRHYLNSTRIAAW